MARQISAKLLDQLEAEYKRTIRSKTSENSDIVEEAEAAIREDIKVAYIQTINDRLSDLGLVVTNTSYRTYDITTGNFIISFDLDGRIVQDHIKERLSDLREAKRQQCEIMKKASMDIERWKIECIKEGKVLPIDIPLLPPIDNGIRCL